MKQPMTSLRGMIVVATLALAGVLALCFARASRMDQVALRLAETLGQGRSAELRSRVTTETEPSRLVDELLKSEFKSGSALIGLPFGVFEMSLVARDGRILFRDGDSRRVEAIGGRLPEWANDRRITDEVLLKRLRAESPSNGAGFLVETHGYNIWAIAPGPAASLIIKIHSHSVLTEMRRDLFAGIGGLLLLAAVGFFGVRPCGKRSRRGRGQLPRVKSA